MKDYKDLREWYLLSCHVSRLINIKVTNKKLYIRSSYDEKQAKYQGLEYRDLVECYRWGKAVGPERFSERKISNKDINTGQIIDFLISLLQNHLTVSQFPANCLAPRKTFPHFPATIPNVRPSLCLTLRGSSYLCGKWSFCWLGGQTLPRWWLGTNLSSTSLLPTSFLVFRTRLAPALLLLLLLWFHVGLEDLLSGFDVFEGIPQLSVTGNRRLFLWRRANLHLP